MLRNKEAQSPSCIMDSPTKVKSGGGLRIHDAESKKEDVYLFCLEQTATDQLFLDQERMSYQASGHFKPYERDFGSGHQEAALADSWEPTERTLRNYLARVNYSGTSTRASGLRQG